MFRTSLRPILTPRGRTGTLSTSLFPSTHTTYIPSHTFASKANRAKHLKQQALNIIAAKSGASTSTSSSPPPSSKSKGRRNIKPMQARTMTQANETHPRTFWYMCAVDGICDGPTALGTTPNEYLPQRVYVDSPTSAEVPPDTQVHTIEEFDASIHPTQYYYYTTPLISESSPYHNVPCLHSELNGFQHPKLAVSAYTVGQVPPIRSHTRDVEIVFCGRSNVGKSSLLNSLTNSQIAHSAQTPGKTQSLNFYALSNSVLSHHKSTASALAYASPINPYTQADFLDSLKWGLDEPMNETQRRQYNEVLLQHGNAPMFYLVDVPGYGFAKAPQIKVDHWNALIGGYMRLRSPKRYPLDEEFVTRYKEAMSKKKVVKSGISQDNIKVQVNEQMEILVNTIQKSGLDINAVTAEDLHNFGIDDAEVVLQQLKDTYQKMMQRDAEQGGAAHNTDNAKASSTGKSTKLPPICIDEMEHGSPLKLVIILVDPTLGLDKSDINFMDFLETFSVPYQVVITKSDRVNRTKLEGVALSIAQTLFPHVYNGIYAKKRVDEGQLTLPLLSNKKALTEMFAEGTEGVTKPLYDMSINEEVVWKRANNTKPRKYCSPVLLSISSHTKENIQVLKKLILHAAFKHV